MRIFVTLPVRGCRWDGGIWPMMFEDRKGTSKGGIGQIFTFVHIQYICILYMYTYILSNHMYCMYGIISF